MTASRAAGPATGMAIVTCGREAAPAAIIRLPRRRARRTGLRVRILPCATPIAGPFRCRVVPAWRIIPRP